MIDPNAAFCRTPFATRPRCFRADFYADVGMPDGISIWLYGMPAAPRNRAVYIGDTPFTLYDAPWFDVYKGDAHSGQDEEGDIADGYTHRLTFDAYKRGYLPQFFDRTISVWDYRLPIKLKPDPGATLLVPNHPFLSLGDGTPHASPVPWIAAGLGVSGLALWWYLRRRGVRG
jgi:hypothetical protein